jgi:hypothetical protein
MPLKEITLGTLPDPLPFRTREFISQADDAIYEFQESIGEQACPLFEPAEYAEVAEAVYWVKAMLDPGPRFGEWGCGFGIAAGIAELAGFDATGIEFDALLLDQARQLHQECELTTSLVQADLFNLSEDEDRSIGPSTFDLIYAYPWPREAPDWIRYFEETAKVGTILLTFHDFGVVRAQRKVL